MPCPVCNQVMCDHTPEERSQTTEQMLDIMMADLKAGKSPASPGNEIYIVTAGKRKKVKGKK
jgi:hypothetical protein